MKSFYFLAIVALLGILGISDAHAVYDPYVGRWLSRDPIGENGGINLYRYVDNDPMAGIDPFGLYTVVQIGMGTSSNPFGHASVATSSNGVQSFGTGTSPGSSFTSYLSSQNAYRNSMLYVLPTTPAQEKTIRGYLNSLAGKLPPVPSKDSGDNCASRTNSALQKAGINLGNNFTPAQLQRALEGLVSTGQATEFSSPQGSTPDPVWQIFNP